MPANLVAIVIAQAIILLAVRLFLRRMHRNIAIDWPVAIGIGIGFGVLMDIVLGACGVFAYLPHGANVLPVEPRKLPLQILLFNALVSYGIASVTIATLARGLVSSQPRIAGWRIRLGLITVCGLVSVALLPNASVAMMFAWGVTLISAAEFALCMGEKTGPFLACVAAGDWRPLFRLWRLSLFVGITYELTNLRFPFWVWLPATSINTVTSTNTAALTALVAAVGYLALLHPMAALYILLREGDRAHGRGSR